jgi:hypothetical protein
MMILLTNHDIDRLSPEFRAELQRLLSDRKNDDFIEEHDNEFGLDLPPDAYLMESGYAKDDVAEAKRVIDITPAEARGLIANISERSLQTLKLFAEDRPILLDELIGDGMPYENMTDLKRSFVGAVTRRLRTVTRNKRATLFLKYHAPDDANDTTSGIAVRPASAQALRIALGFPELPQTQG